MWSWFGVSSEKRMEMARDWFRELLPTFGDACEIKISKSTGKPYLVVRLIGGSYASIAHKRDGWFSVHYPYSTGGRGERCDSKADITQYLRKVLTQ